MTVFGGVLLFVSGVVLGGAAVAYNYHTVRTATCGLRKENERLKDCALKDKLESESRRAYEEGYARGRRSPMSDVERLASTLESRHVDFRAGKGGMTNGQAAKR